MHSPLQDPVGRHLALDRQTARIVGVVADIHDDGLDVPVTPRVYFPLFQRPGYALTLFYRSSVDPASLRSALRQPARSGGTASGRTRLREPAPLDRR